MMAYDQAQRSIIQSFRFKFIYFLPDDTKTFGLGPQPTDLTDGQSKREPKIEVRFGLRIPKTLATTFGLIKLSAFMVFELFF